MPNSAVRDVLLEMLRHTRRSCRQHASQDGALVATVEAIDGVHVVTPPEGTVLTDMDALKLAAFIVQSVAGRMPQRKSCAATDAVDAAMLAAREVAQAEPHRHAFVAGTDGRLCCVLVRDYVGGPPRECQRLESVHWPDMPVDSKVRRILKEHISHGERTDG